MRNPLLPPLLLCAGLAACTAPDPAAPPTAGGSAPAGEVDMAKRVPGAGGDAMHFLRAFGNEPFWSVRVEGDALVFLTPEDPTGQAMQGQRQSLDDELLISGEAGSRSFSLRLKRGECNDGMSDNEYEWISEFQLGADNYQGCAELAK